VVPNTNGRAQKHKGQLFFYLAVSRANGLFFAIKMSRNFAS
jgi:hypothetical protein